MLDLALTPEQLTVISALSSGASITDAAEEAGIHRNTINNWRRNQYPFQHALAEAQYDRALYYREQAEALVPQAYQAINQILADPKTSPSVRLKAALALIQLATAPPPPKRQMEFVMQSPVQSQNLHNSAQSTRVSTPSAAPTSSAPPAPAPTAAPKPQQIVHNFAQQPIRREAPKIGRNDACPCGSGLKYKRCCIDKHAAALSHAA